jgi:hypothetical protein
MGSACAMHGREEKCTEIMTGEPERGDFLKDLGEAGRIILKRILRWYGMGYVNMVMNFRVPYEADNILSS